MNMNLDEILERLESLSNREAVESMRRYGITPTKASGVSIPTLRGIAKESVGIIN